MKNNCNKIEKIDIILLIFIGYFFNNGNINIVIILNNSS